MNGYEKDFGYSQAVLIDKTLYISGTMAVDANGRLVAPGDDAQPIGDRRSGQEIGIVDKVTSVREIVHSRILSRRWPESSKNPFHRPGGRSATL
jgi:hypothetical protein